MDARNGKYGKLTWSKESFSKVRGSKASGCVWVSECVLISIIQERKKIDDVK